MSRRRTLPPLLVALLLAALLHGIVGWWFVRQTWLADRPPAPPDTPLRLTLIDVPPPPVEEPEPEPEPEQPMGQVVDVAPPDKPERPDEARFLAERDNTVEKETVDPRYRIDREVTAPTYSPDDAYENAESIALEQPLPSTGATAGRELFQSGRYSLFPDRQSLWDQTNKEGLDLPVPSSHSASRMAGAPSNDWLPEIEKSDQTHLQTREFLFADYINKVQQLISFFANQTLRNVGRTAPLVRSRYSVGFRLNIAASGSVAAFEIVGPSGVPQFDDAIRQAVALAAPFPEPPSEGLGPDGSFELPGEFVIPIGRAAADMSGIDPRAGVQFPGLVNVPR